MQIKEPFKVTQYQTMLYKAVFIDLEFGWDAGDEIFASQIYTSPTDAMQELNFTDPIFNNWFATMKMIEDGEVVEEEWFDSSVIEID
jgi:hypothetical protein